MDRFISIILERPRTVIACVVLVTALLAVELRSLRPEVDLRDLMPSEHPYVQIDERLRQDFGAGLTAIVAIGVREGDIFNAQTLRLVAQVTDEISGLSGVVPGSLISVTSDNAKTVRLRGGVVEVGPLVDSIPEDDGGIDALRSAIGASPLYKGYLVTPDLRGALVLVDFEESADVEETTDALEGIARRARSDRVDVFVGGQPPALAALQGATREIAPLLLLALVVIAAVHYEAFRTGQAIALPIVSALLSVVWSLGLTSLLGVRLTPWTALTTILVLSVAAGHAVQILKRYYECYSELGNTRDAVRTSIESVGPVMVTAGFVAAAGFASLASFGVPAVRSFGLVAACGIVSAILIELTFTPAVRVLLPPPRAAEATREGEHRFLGAAMAWLSELVIRHRTAVLGIGLAVVVVASSGVAMLRVNTSFRSWFGDDEPVIVAERAIRERFVGTSTIRVRISSESDQDLATPAVLRGIAALEAELAKESDVSSTLSVVDYLQEMHGAFREDGAASVLEADGELISQYLLLFGSEDLARVVTADHRVAMVHALARSDDVAWVERLFSRLRDSAVRTMPAGVRVEVAGGELAQAAANNQMVVREKLENLFQVGLVIFVLAAVVFRSLVAGSLVLAPLCCAVVVNLGVMGWAGTWLSFATASYASMGVSLGADFAIYLLFRLREEMREAPLEAALSETLRTSGQAIFFVASAIAAGYATLMVSSFALWRQLGGYVALMMAVSALATVTILPALILTVRPRFLGEKRPVPAR